MGNNSSKDKEISMKQFNGKHLDNYSKENIIKEFRRFPAFGKCCINQHLIKHKVTFKDDVYLLEYSVRHNCCSGNDENKIFKYYGYFNINKEICHTQEELETSNSLIKLQKAQYVLEKIENDKKLQKQQDEIQKQHLQDTEYQQYIIQKQIQAQQIQRQNSLQYQIMQKKKSSKSMIEKDNMILKNDEIINQDIMSKSRSYSQSNNLKIQDQLIKLDSQENSSLSTQDETKILQNQPVLFNHIFKQINSNCVKNSNIFSQQDLNNEILNVNVTKQSLQLQIIHPIDYKQQQINTQSIKQNSDGQIQINTKLNQINTDKIKKQISFDLYNEIFKRINNSEQNNEIKIRKKYSCEFNIETCSDSEFNQQLQIDTNQISNQEKIFMNSQNNSPLLFNKIYK